MNKVRLVPSLLTDNPETLENMVRLVETFTSYVQFDIMDGEFVPSRSVTTKDLAHLQTRLCWEVHLMVLHPETYLEDFRQAGAKKIVFHHEATNSPQEVISLTRSLNLRVGLAVNPETPISEINPLVNEIDSVLFLSVHPGFYGSKFLPEVLEKIAAFRDSHPGIEIGIDGGVKENNIARIVSSGVDTIYVGSAVLLHPQPAESFRHLLAIANDTTHQ